jgi:ABC-type bacteriocin/lantibiotic exporter with double-glycine peptidase domain
MPDYLEFIGRLDYILEEFNTMLGKKQNIHEIISKTYSPIAVEFKKIQFKNVSFTYNDKQAMPIFDNLTVDVNTNNKIIGMTGLSGKGKSSFAKLLLRLYEPTSGSIYIDGVDVTTIDPNYIRENITYVNQNSRLFDKKIIDNMVYGCNSPETCQNHLQEIMRYPTIKQLYQNVDVLNGKAGSLGENLSGGQRQVVNIISGLINPSKILILDEPTNALDSALKTEVIALINHFRQYKQCIIIITHDKDVHSLFDETLQI